MGLASAFNTAAAGLTVTSRRAEVASSNIANAGSAGYARREIVVGSNAAGSGPKVVDVSRQTNAWLTADRRTAGAKAEASDFTATGLLRLEQAFGTLGEGYSLTDLMDSFDAALIEAAASPESDATLLSVLTSAQALAEKFGDISETIRQTRAEADAEIGRAVDSLNDSLVKIDEFDRMILSARGAGRETASLEDQRQALVDEVATIIPLQEVARPDGTKALIALNGAVLLDGRPAEFSFDPAGYVSASPDQALSGLQLNGKTISTGAGSLIAGGTLGAAFIMRDETTVELQGTLDGLAQSLISRLEAADTTRTGGEAGLFTDAGAALDASSVDGLAARIRVNTLADPDQGGSLRLIREGFGAATVAAEGDSALLQSLHEALSAENPLSLSGEAADLMASLSTRRTTAESDLSLHSARASVLAEAEAEIGVDTDQEMQDLLLIEQSYAANAKVLQVIDGLLATLLEI